jgi:hypothetical protein
MGGGLECAVETRGGAALKKNLRNSLRKRQAERRIAAPLYIMVKHQT